MSALRVTPTPQSLENKQLSDICSSRSQLLIHDCSCIMMMVLTPTLSVPGHQKSNFSILLFHGLSVSYTILQKSCDFFQYYFPSYRPLIDAPVVTLPNCRYVHPHCLPAGYGNNPILKADPSSMDRAGAALLKSEDAPSFSHPLYCLMQIASPLAPTGP